ncbi:acyl carrier protein [Anabaena sp. PCC 7938]|uniref:Phosphopantetheine-binding protein n=1 Tax=Anabaena cylindrica (strain ATCC 27899 / PCC 7122) TaxID=272123 RepID=K9ZM61_ANACC|nr:MULTISPECIES: acyl carrier protein [Anabaena]AFZ59874.1 phosphopantetheine-binding protein [Anabaena cylindrica PCC 7122]MCM2409876.1 acyl carrier protein [Anabaena sp. CCAP 1446/1C]BAY03072.1 phosphopantetheine-binding protein [Anabaena cylindrica PCC 7122]
MMQVQNSNSKLNTLNAVDTIQGWLVNQIATQLGINAQTIKVTEPLTRYGLDSIDSVTIVGDMEDWLDAELPSTLLWDYPTIEKAAQYLVNELSVLPSATTVTKAAAVASKPKEETTIQGKGWGGIWSKISGS